MDNTIEIPFDKTQAEDPHKYLKKVFFRFGLGFLLLNIISSFSQTVIVYVINEFMPSLWGSHFVYNAVSMLPIYLFGFPALFLLTRSLRTQETQSLPLSPLSAVTLLCISFTAMSVGSRISTALIGLFSIFRSDPMSNPVQSMTSGGDVIVNLLFLSVLAPVLEELLFRRYLCRRLLPFGNTVAIFASSAIFGLVHCNFFQVFYAFLVGLVLGYAYVTYGKLYVPIILHALLNFFGGVLPALVSDKLLSISPDATLEVLLGVLPYLLLFLLYSYYTTAFSVCGVAFLAINRKKIALSPLPPQLDRAKTARAILLNVGTILLIVYLVSQYILTLFI